MVGLYSRSGQSTQEAGVGEWVKWGSASEYRLVAMDLSRPDVTTYYLASWLEKKTALRRGARPFRADRLAKLAL